jgi:acyl-CoA thioester hydrolase
MAKHETRIRVRYAETDQMGVVYHANYLVWMEIGRVELVRSRGCNYKELEHSAGLLLSVVEAQCRYLYPARYDQEIVIETEIVLSNSRMVQFEYEIHSVEPRRRLATGMTKHVWVNRDMRLTKLPPEYQDLLAIG